VLNRGSLKRMEIDINLETIHYAIDADIVRPKSGDGRNVLGLLVALGAGIAFGLVLAVCLEGQCERAAPRTSVPASSRTMENAAEDESVRPSYAIVLDKRLGSVARQLATHRTISRNTVAPDYRGFGNSDWPDPKRFAHTFGHYG
jgi:hypothetical protein